MSQKCFDKIYGKCCKIFITHLTSRLCFYPAKKLFWFASMFLFFKLSLWRNLYHINRLLIYKKINKASLYVIEICVSHYATELEWIWFLWIGIWNLNYVKQETPFQAFSYKFCEFSHNYSFWDFMLIKSALLNVIKNHKFDSFKTHKSFFL